MELKALQKEVDEWIQKIGKGYYSELTNTCILLEEAGEFSRLIAREYGEQSYKEGKKPADIKKALRDELSDILWVLICLANQQDINLSEGMRENFRKKTERDTERHRDRKRSDS